jgi:hypothetical protein
MADQLLDLQIIFGVLSSRCAEAFSTGVLARVARNAGLDLSSVKGTDLNRRAPILGAMESSFSKLSEQQQRSALAAMGAALFANEEDGKKAQEALAIHHIAFVNGGFSRIDVLDPKEADFLPKSATAELATAIERLHRKDATGALTSACGAVDTVMQAVFAKYGLGDPGKIAFAAKVGTACDRLAVWGATINELKSLGWSQPDAENAAAHLQRATNAAAEALQLFRKRMSDAHGQKPAEQKTVYECVKLASAICGLFEGKV